MTAQRHAVVIGGPDAIRARLEGDGIIVADRIEGPLDLLVVISVGPTPDIAFRDVTDDDFRATLNDGLFAFVDAVQRALPLMAPGGAIVQVVSRAHLGAWRGVHVAASAAACVAMARSMAIEVAPLGIRVNCVATGPGDEGVADVVAWLAGPDSGAVTGETILADRGASLQLTQSARR